MTVMRLWWARPLAVVVGLVIALTGCGVAENGASPGTASSRPGGSEMQTDLDSAVQSSETYWDSFFQAQGSRFVPVQDIFPYDEEGDGDCAGQAFVLNNAFYCPAGHFIAYDENFIAGQFEAIGDAFVYYLIGHEYAHAVQESLGIQHGLTIEHELQADCMAGAYLGDSVRANLLQVEDGDIDELLSALASVGDQPGIPWFAEGAHGTGRQRTRAFGEGYNGTAAGGSSLDLCFRT